MQRFRQLVRQPAWWALLLAAWPAWQALRLGPLADPLEAAAGPPPPPALVRQGRQLAVQYQCAACHRAPGVAGVQGGVGPTLAQFGRRSYIAGRVPHTPEALQRWLMNPPALVPGTAMPHLGVPGAHARALAAWLQDQR